jgi:hypothetical protein
MTQPEVLPGDVIAVRTGGWAGRLIRFGAAIHDTANLSNHIAIVHHRDIEGTLWCIAASPGGVGQQDATTYLNSKWTITNAAQPKTQAQRVAVCATMTAMLGTPYDWAQIATDAGNDFGLGTAWKRDFTTGQIPTHVVCSSLAAYAYSKNGLPHPTGPDRALQPSDWSAFILTRGWETTAT